MVDRVITDDKFPCPKCGNECENTNYIDGEKEDVRTYRCSKCEFVFNTTEKFIPGTLKPPPPGWKPPKNKGK